MLFLYEKILQVTLLFVPNQTTSSIKEWWWLLTCPEQEEVSTGATASAWRPASVSVLCSWHIPSFKSIRTILEPQAPPCSCCSVLITVCWCRCGFHGESVCRGIRCDCWHIRARQQHGPDHAVAVQVGCLIIHLFLGGDTHVSHPLNVPPLVPSWSWYL